MGSICIHTPRVQEPIKNIWILNLFSLELSVENIIYRYRFVFFNGLTERSGQLSGNADEGWYSESELAFVMKLRFIFAMVSFS